MNFGLVNSAVASSDGMKEFRRFLFIELFFIAIVLLIGTVCFHFLEGWAWFDSFYFLVVTMATIGYGDFVPVTIGGKILTMVFAVMGVPLFFYTSSMMLSFRLKGYAKHYAELVEKRKATQEVASQKTSSLSWFWSLFGRKQKNTTSHDIHHTNNNSNDNNYNNDATTTDDSITKEDE